MANAAPRRPHGFWEEVNAYFRQVMEDEGRKPVGGDLRRIYNTNVHRWFPNAWERPDWKSFRIHVKSLKSVEYVRQYFRDYRAEKSQLADKSQRTDKRYKVDRSYRPERSCRAAKRAAGDTARRDQQPPHLVTFLQQHLDRTSHQQHEQQHQQGQYYLQQHLGQRSRRRHSSQDMEEDQEGGTDEEEQVEDMQAHFMQGSMWAVAGNVNLAALLGQGNAGQGDGEGADDDDDDDDDSDDSSDDGEDDGEDQGEGDTGAAGALLDLTTTAPAGDVPWDTSLPQGELTADAVMAAGLLPGALPLDPPLVAGPQGCLTADGGVMPYGGVLPGAGQLPTSQDQLLQLIQLQNLQLQQLQLQLQLQVQAIYGSGLAPALAMPLMQVPLPVMYGAPAMMAPAGSRMTVDGDADIYSTSPPV